MERIGEFELVDHGIEDSQYFQGCGVAHTKWTNAVSGIGDTPAAATDDCLELMAQGGWDTEGMKARIMAQKGWKRLPTTPDIHTIYGSIEDIYCHVSIRWNSLCEGCYRNPCECLPDDCNCDPN